MSKEALIPNLLELFRQYGYEGVTVSRISEATGLGKASLYHHFPKGKEQMADEVLAHIRQSIQRKFIAPLREPGPARQKLVKMAKVVQDFYQAGQKGCLVDGLTLGDANRLFQHKIAACLEAWIDAIADVGVEAGLDKKTARERAENVVIAIEGALVVSRALGDCSCFRRVVRDLPAMILAN
jgi:AcrR family transcriptional regulator